MPVTEPKSRIVAETPADANCFVGFHDIFRGRRTTQ